MIGIHVETIRNITKESSKKGIRFLALDETKANLRLLVLFSMKTERLYPTRALNPSYYTKDAINELLAEERAKKEQP